jgi:hypothetical protein
VAHSRQIDIFQLIKMLINTLKIWPTQGAIRKDEFSDKKEY